jgi:AmmeMemoRadiSam system protein A
VPPLARNPDEPGGEHQLHPLIALAQQAVEECVRYGRITSPSEITPEMQGRAGVFVTIKRGADLRGCIGTVEPRQTSIALEVVHNAIAAATADPRFLAVAEDELRELRYGVDVLMPPERIDGLEDLDPRTYGVIVEIGQRRGLLLPDLEGVDTAEQQVAYAMAKAAILPGEPVTLYRFTVQRYGEK